MGFRRDFGRRYKQPSPIARLTAINPSVADRGRLSVSKLTRAKTRGHFVKPSRFSAGWSIAEVMQNDCTDTVADPAWDEPKTTTFTHAGYLRGYASVEITLVEGADPNEIQAALDDGKISFSKMLTRGFQCGPLLLRGEIVGSFRIEDQTFGFRPTEGWEVMYHPEDGEFSEMSPSGSWHY